MADRRPLWPARLHHLGLVSADAGALAPVLGGREGRIVLLRPDRYVAGAFAADEAPAFAEALGNLMDRGTAGM